MSWQDDCAAKGGTATVFPAAVPLDAIFPEIPGVPGTITVPAYPACRVPNGDGTYTYSLPSLSLADRYSIASDALGDEAMASLVGPLDAIQSAVSAVTTPIAWALGLGVVAVGLYLFARK